MSGNYPYPYSIFELGFRCRRRFRESLNRTSTLIWWSEKSNRHIASYLFADGMMTFEPKKRFLGDILSSLKVLDRKVLVSNTFRIVSKEIKQFWNVCLLECFFTATLKLFSLRKSDIHSKRERVRLWFYDLSEICWLWWLSLNILFCLGIVCSEVSCLGEHDPINNSLMKTYGWRTCRRIMCDFEKRKRLLGHSQDIDSFGIGLSHSVKIKWRDNHFDVSSTILWNFYKKKNKWFTQPAIYKCFPSLVVKTIVFKLIISKFFFKKEFVFTIIKVHFVK